MSKYNRVLIPIDLTLGRGALSPAVQQIVDNSDAEITLLHVVDSQSRLGRNNRTLHLMTELELFGHRQFRRAQISRRIEWGRPVDCILNAIRAVRADVVLMSAGPAPLAGNALSPVVTDVLTEAACPVLLEWPVTAPVNHARDPPRVLRRRIRSRRGSRPARSRLGGGAHAGAAEIGLRARTRRRQHVAALGSGRTRPRNCPRHVRVWKTCAIAGRPVPKCTSAWGCRSRYSAGPSGPHRAALLVTGSSHEALLAAESECPVLYVPSARRMRVGTARSGPAGGVRRREERIMVPPRRRHKLRDQVAGTLKVILLSGGLLGGLWLLQMIARD